MAGKKKRTEAETANVADKPRWDRTEEDKARHRTIRAKFQAEKPSLEQLIASGEYNEPMPLGDYLSVRQAVAALKKAREVAGLSLADVAERSGIDRAQLSRIENGQHMNPTVSTLSRYAHALGMRWVWRLEKEREEASATVGENK